ncbi:MAG: hypothetical protein LBF22_10095 [Deltaproteobacteria bacterium]|nr:hypothetical protein [Deltaproteobacteria bacterium]
MAKIVHNRHARTTASGGRKFEAGKYVQSGKTCPEGWLELWKTGKKRSREILIKQVHIGSGLERFVTSFGFQT